MSGAQLPGLPPTITQPDLKTDGGAVLTTRTYRLCWHVEPALFYRVGGYRDAPMRYLLDENAMQKQLTELGEGGWTVHSILSDGTIVAYKYAKEEE